MENINYNDEMKKIFKDCISPYLKNQGFKKNGKTFYKEKSEFIYVLNVQYGCSNSKKFSYFTYNIKISSPSFYEKFGMKYEKKVDCAIIDYRLGHLLGILNKTYISDYWYRIGNDPAIYYFDRIEDILINNAIKNNESKERIEELRLQGKYYSFLEKRYDKTNVEEAKKIILADLDNIIIPFLSNIINSKDLCKLITANLMKTAFEQLFLVYYFIENEEIETGLKLAKELYDSGIFKNAIDIYLMSKGLTII